LDVVFEYFLEDGFVFLEESVLEDSETFMPVEFDYVFLASKAP
jgi:hypothetical protein